MEFLSSPDVATMYGIPLRTVQAACRSGAIKAQRFGRMWIIPEDQAAAYADRWHPRGHTNGHNGKELPVNGDYEMEEQTVTRQVSPGKAVWSANPLQAGQPVWEVDKTQNRRVLKASNRVGFDDYQPRAWQEVKDLFDVSRLSAPETANGPGSTVELTEPIRAWLPKVLSIYDITTMLDAPCGDWNWLRYVDLRHLDHYIGWDVVDELVRQAQTRAFEKDVKSTFSVVNLLTVDEVPQVDLILSRDFLAHLPDEAVLKVLNKFVASGSRYLLTSHYPDSDNVFDYDPKDYAWIGYAERTINFEREPFKVGRKVDACPELPGPHGVIAQPHELALFEL